MRARDNTEACECTHASAQFQYVFGHAHTSAFNACTCPHTHTYLQAHDTRMFLRSFLTLSCTLLLPISHPNPSSAPSTAYPDHQDPSFDPLMEQPQFCNSTPDSKNVCTHILANSLRTVSRQDHMHTHPMCRKDFTRETVASCNEFSSICVQPQKQTTTRNRCAMQRVFFPLFGTTKRNRCITQRVLFPLCSTTIIRAVHTRAYKHIHAHTLARMYRF